MANSPRRTPASFRYIPFAVYMVFIALDDSLRFFAGQGLFRLEETALYYLYPVKTLIVGCLLFKFKNMYSELDLKDLVNIPATLSAIGTGLLVFVLWVTIDWTFSAAVVPRGFNVSMLPGHNLQVAMASFRVAGAVLVVPLMEELFWRSFLIRYLIDTDFENVKIGSFSIFSFIITVVLFGLEHNYILAGMMAGICYSLLLYRTRSIAQCVLSHTVTNLGVAVYVVSTGAWHFW